MDSNETIIRFSESVSDETMRRVTFWRQRECVPAHGDQSDQMPKSGLAGEAPIASEEPEGYGCEER